MGLEAVLAVSLGAAVGAPVRFWIERALAARLGTGFPWGTLAVNLVGSLALGLLVGAALDGRISRLVLLGVGTGLCGALTTFSAFAAQLRDLWSRSAALAIGYGLGSVVVGCLLAWFGVSVFGT